MPIWRTSVILFLAAGLFAGCTSLGQGIYLPSDRTVVRTPAPTRASARVYHQADRDARNYVRSVNRSVRMTPRQQELVRDRINRRSYALLDRTHPRDHRYVYPFPRRVNERDRTVQRFWRDVDRDVERALNPYQRRAYRDFVHYNFERGARHNRPRHPLGGPPGQRRR